MPTRSISFHYAKYILPSRRRRQEAGLTVFGKPRVNRKWPQLANLSNDDREYHRWYKFLRRHFSPNQTQKPTNTMSLNRNDPVYFKLLPLTEGRKTNAVFLRDMGDCNGEPCCEILHHQEKWIVRNSEALPPSVAFKKTAEKYRDEINATGKTKPGEIAKELGICVGTLRKRRKLIANHLG